METEMAFQMSIKKYEKLINALCQAQRLLKPRTVERRVLRAILHKGCVQRDMEGLLEKLTFPLDGVEFDHKQLQTTTFWHLETLFV